MTENNPAIQRKKSRIGLKNTPTLLTTGHVYAIIVFITRTVARVEQEK